MSPSASSDKVLVKDWKAYMKKLRKDDMASYHLVNRWIAFVTGKYETKKKSLTDHIFSLPAVGLWIVIVVTVFASLTAVMNIIEGAEAVKMVELLVAAGTGGGAAGAAGGYVYGKVAGSRPKSTPTS